MPLSARCLYFTLGMFADDDGFVNSPKGIMRQCGASIDDLNILMAKKFILSFESGVIVIKHWRINNYLRNDRYQETKYIEEKEHLNISENGSYSLGIPSIGQESTEQGSIVKSTRFVPPTLDEIKDYCLERNNNVDPNKFYDFYQAKGWMVGKNKMKDWKAAIRTWENRDKKPSNQPRDIFKELRDC
jgi:hypothetical protein